MQPGRGVSQRSSETLWHGVQGKGAWEADLPKGMDLRIASSYFLSILAVMSDAMKPGATALQVMFLEEYSLAIDLVSPITPACQDSLPNVNLT